MALPSDSFDRHNDDDRHIDEKQESRESNHHIATGLSNLRIAHKSVQQDKVVLNQNKYAFIGYLKSLGTSSLIKVLVADVNDLEQSHVNHKLHLYAWVVEQNKCDDHKQRPAH